MQAELNRVLQSAAAQGILNIGDVEAVMHMTRNQILKKYHYWQGANGKWFVKLPDKDGKKKLVKRSTQEAIEDTIIEFDKEYAAADRTTATFEDVYYMWREVHDQLVVEKSARKYDTDYERFFKDTAFSKMDVKKITDDDVLIFMRNSIERYKLSKEAARKLYGYITNTIFTARKNKLTTDNPVEFIKTKDFYKWCTDRIKSEEESVVSDDDMEKLYDRLQQDHSENPNYIPSYAVELAMLTGMRVGELAALSWDRITDQYILIDRSEKSDSTEKNFWIDKTKNGKARKFPVTSEIKQLLNRIKEIEIEYNYFCEWVFANETGRIHKNILSYCIKNKCRQLKIKQRGIHALRKTLNSNMRCNGVSATVAASLLGHSTAVNEKYYTFDVTSLDEKTRIVSEINEVTCGNLNKCSSAS